MPTAINDLRDDLRSRHGDGALAELREFCALKIEEWRNDLETASGERVFKLQGKVQGLREVLDEINPTQPLRTDKPRGYPV